ncbi:lamina-associated polypeptide 2, isoforms alpha/zeta-like [Anomaloglossus baeobatrachus]
MMSTTLPQHALPRSLPGRAALFTGRAGSPACTASIAEPAPPIAGPDRQSSREASDCSEDDSDAVPLQDSEQAADIRHMVNSLIEAVNQTLKVQVDPVSSQSTQISFKRVKRAQNTFSGHPEFAELLRSHRQQPDRVFTSGKSIDLHYPFPEGLRKDWAGSPVVDPPISRLSSHTVLPLTNGTSLKDPTDRTIDRLARSAFEAAGSSLSPAFASVWVAKALMSWADTLRCSLRAIPANPDLVPIASQISLAGEYLLNAALASASCATQAASNNVAIRRALWLRSWNADAASKKSLTSLPFLGERLFGDRLDQLISDATGGKSTSLPQLRPKRFQNRRSTARFRPFRSFSSNPQPRKSRSPPRDRKTPSFKTNPAWRSRPRQSTRSSSGYRRRSSK